MRATSYESKPIPPSPAPPPGPIITVIDDRAFVDEKLLVLLDADATAAVWAERDRLQAQLDAAREARENAVVAARAQTMVRSEKPAMNVAAELLAEIRDLLRERLPAPATRPTDHDDQT